MQLPFMVPLPEEGSVFDYFLNLKQYQFIPWSQRAGTEPGHGHTKGMKSSGYVPLPEVEKNYNLYILVLVGPGLVIRP